MGVAKVREILYKSQILDNMIGTNSTEKKDSDYYIFGYEEWDSFFSLRIFQFHVLIDSIVEKTKIPRGFQYATV